ncbi:YybH family protein [Roseiterribacter gracilis]|uniref:SnoaL-like domain-containing protein n=1 Tax=Roseiterribacter gracilis TaxID=2812848 RepID=A0A8S8X855_9PROT|nr:hypothetical protein TMPK1_01980 [Rhodospirillales bacterium TMPK1]
MIETLFERYARAVRAKDAASFLALYADEARVFDLWDRWSYDGVAARRRSIEDWFGSLGDETVEVRFDEVRITSNGDIAVAHAFTSFTAYASDGTALRSMQNRLSWGLQRRDDGWRIIHEHTSAPLIGETMEVQLVR